MVSVQTPLGQLFKIPLLIEHFIKHKKQDGLSLLNFLSDHYTTRHNGADLVEHERLPFKNIPVYNMGYALIAPNIQPAALAAFSIAKKTAVAGTCVLQHYAGNVFHPPKV